MNFKHLVVVGGSKVNLRRFADEAHKVGYINAVSKAYDTHDGYVLTFNYRIGDYLSVDSGRVNRYSNPTQYWREKGVKYVFDIDEEWQFQAALGIIAMREGDIFSKGEMVVCKEADSGLFVGNMYKITKGNYVYAYLSDLCVNLEDFSTSPYFAKRFTRATPEQIIQYYKNQFKITEKMEQFKLPEKWYVLYKDRAQFDKLNSWKRAPTWTYVDPTSYNGIVGGRYPYAHTEGLYWLNGKEGQKAVEREGYKEITFEQFEEYVLNEKSFTLPPKWFVLYKNKEEFDILNNYEKAPSWIYYAPESYGNVTGGYKMYPDQRGLSWISGKRSKEILERDGYKQITFEQFKKYVLKSENMKKVLGYKAPHDLRGGLIKAGTLFTEALGHPFKAYSAVGTDKSVCLMEAEIVEKWTPEYDTPKETTITLGSRGQKVVVSSLGFKFRDNTASISQVESVLEKANKLGLSGYIADFGIAVDKSSRFIRIGCADENNLFSISELETARDTYYKVTK